MTTFYCTNCWTEVPESAAICPHCHAEISERISQADYGDKLIAALRHKEPMTPVRAAWILGERREQKAVPALTKIVIRVGGSIPILSSFRDALGAETLLLGLGLPDCRMHSPNENFPLENLKAGIRLNQILLRELAGMV